MISLQVQKYKYYLHVTVWVIVMLLEELINKRRKKIWKNQIYSNKYLNNYHTYMTKTRKPILCHTIVLRIVNLYILLISQLLWSIKWTYFKFRNKKKNKHGVCISLRNMNDLILNLKKKHNKILKTYVHAVCVLLYSVYYTVTTKTSSSKNHLTSFEFFRPLSTPYRTQQI